MTTVTYETWTQETRQAFRTHHGQPPWQCFRCGDPVTSLRSRSGLIHHIDGDQQNSQPRNLTAIHPWCHDQLHDELYDLKIRSWDEQPPVPALTAGRLQCESCQFVFGGESTFNLHRTGTFQPDNRRCLSPEEMLAKGLEPDPEGVWRNGPEERGPIPTPGARLEDDRESAGSTLAHPLLNPALRPSPVGEGYALILSMTTRPLPPCKECGNAFLPGEEAHVIPAGVHHGQCHPSDEDCRWRSW